MSLRTRLPAFHDLPIRQKLMVLLIGTATATLLIAGLVIVVADSLLFSEFLRRDLATFARIIADNSTATLAFEDAKSAKETLAALRARTHIVSACLYRTDKSILASYARDSGSQPCPVPDATREVASRPGHLTVTESVLLEGRPVGALTILYDLDEIGERIRLYGATVLLVLILSSVFALFLATQLSRILAKPILQLANATTSVSASRDYTIRAEKTSNDEIGTLVDGFNEMLASIESRDRGLRSALVAQKEALQEASRLNADLQRSYEDLERFAFVASHDLQEPLRNIAISSQLLIRQYPKDFDEHAQKLVDRIVAGTVRMQELLSDVRGYVELAAAKNTPETTVDLNGALEKAMENLKVSIEESGAVVTSDRLPVVDNAYQGHFVPLFQNLLSNSIKYRGATSPRIHIKVSEESKEHYRLAVSDNGIGIAPEYHTKVFVPFKRLHGSDLPGTGIGLAICQRVVERYGGRIWVESEAGRGATFLFTIPRRSADQEVV